MDWKTLSTGCHPNCETTEIEDIQNVCTNTTSYVPKCFGITSRNTLIHEALTLFLNTSVHSVALNVVAL